MGDKYDELLRRADVQAAEFDVLFNHSLVGVCYVDAEGKFLRVNNRFAYMLGYSRKELEGRKCWTDITHPQDVDVTEEEMADLKEGKSDQYTQHKRYLHKDGTSVYCEVQVNRVAGQDSVFVHFLQQSRIITLPDSNVTIIKDKNGNPILQPIVPLQQFIWQNWKWLTATLLPIGAGLLGWIGTSVNNYYEIKAKYDAQQDVLKGLNERIEHLQKK